MTYPFLTLQHIETPRLILRPLQLGDEIPINKAIHNSLNILQKWMPWAQDPSLETTRAFVEKNVKVREDKTARSCPMVVMHKQSQKIIGASGYNERSNPEKGLYDIGYWCDTRYQGQGYVTEYVNALTRYALQNLGAQKVVIYTEVKNTKSIAVATRLNFTKTGTKPSVTKENALDYCFTCESLNNLPALNIIIKNKDIDHA